jgi:hypothetical protein
MGGVKAQATKHHQAGHLQLHITDDAAVDSMTARNAGK